MTFRPSRLAGAFLIEVDRIPDERGFFGRAGCKREFEVRGLLWNPVQINIGWNAKRGTLRGMHYQAAPHAEVKLVRCTRGVVYDVIVDLRPDSATYRDWEGFELTAENRHLLYVPEGFAHGYLTLADETELHYMTSQFFAPEAARIVRYNDPAFGIRWPEEARVISEKDRACPDFKPAADRRGTP